MVELAVSRLSNYSDYIPLMVSERLIDTEQDYTGQFIRISGQFRSYNRHEEKKNRLVLSVFVRELEFLDEIDENEKTNQFPSAAPSRHLHRQFQNLICNKCTPVTAALV